MVEAVEDFAEVVDKVQTPRDQTAAEDATGTAPRRRRPSPNLLLQETVPMTVLAQDPSVVGPQGPVRALIPVPAERLQRGPRGHRFHVVDVDAGTGRPSPPVVLHDDDPWVYRDRWSKQRHPDATTLSQDREFRAQNVYAVAAHTLSVVEQYLGRPVPWHSGAPQLFLIPQARVEANAFYSRQHNGVLFGWLPALAGRPALYTSLSYDVVAHEVTHAILDGLRPRFAEPGLPDQLAFHEALADLVALLSVFTLEGVAADLLGADHGRVRLDADGIAATDPDATLLTHRADALMRSPLARLAEQVGARGRPAGADPARPPALRWSVLLQAGTAWKKDPQFAEPHRRSEVLVAAFMQTLVTMWAARLQELRTDPDGTLDAGRVAEEGVKSAQHLLGMLLRALDYLPPVDLEFADVIDAVLTADRRLAPNDDHGYRDAIRQSFNRFGIRPPHHHIVDADGTAAPTHELAADGPVEKPALAAYPPDPDAGSFGVRYEHLNLAVLRTSPEAVFQFLWNNAAPLSVDVRFPTRVERVLTSTRVGPDGLVVTEILADYTQSLRTTVGDLPPDLVPAGMPADDVVEMQGGGVLVFDQFGRFRLHQRQPLLEAGRQKRRLEHLFANGIRAKDGTWGAADGDGNPRLFARLHQAARDAEE